MDITFLADINPTERFNNGDFFLDLPGEILHLLLCSYVGPQACTNLSACSSSLSMLCSDDKFWRDFCCKELHVKPKQLGVSSYSVVQGQASDDDVLVGSHRLAAASAIPFRSLYSQLVHPFRGLFGKLLVSFTSVYGDILTLTHANGLITGEVWMLPKTITDRMKPVVDFVICLDGEGRPMVIHQFCMDGSSKVVLTGNPLQKTWNRLIHRIRKDGISYPNASNNEDAPLRLHRLALDKFADFLLSVQAVNACCRYEYHIQNNPPRQIFSSGIELPLGFFKGTYGAHGIELIKMEYAEDTRNLRGIKITGDPNVPAGKISFEFPIDHAVILPLEGQHDVDFLELLHQTGPFHAVDRLTVGKQDFRFPMGVSLREASHVNLVGDSCIFRLVGHGTIAEHGFINPTSIIAHIAVLSPEKFVVFWLGGYNFASLFVKVSLDDRFCEYI
ncbi:F-box only protein 31-like isoform X2 [Paramacrobiotus metropolitanus]|uniref:F-box only protein 31-like isoform X2 n=1 Tax=Paramacrobiotus metropolitanus TaxID=2943436 RepID=UPI002445FE00|nr:F-box only protein 31-like isoform X2 [Paramacrobiotus metropolitanus]